MVWLAIGVKSKQGSCRRTCGWITSFLKDKVVPILPRGGEGQPDLGRSLTPSIQFPGNRRAQGRAPCLGL